MGIIVKTNGDADGNGCQHCGQMLVIAGKMIVYCNCLVFFETNGNASQNAGNLLVKMLLGIVNWCTISPFHNLALCNG